MIDAIVFDFGRVISAQKPDSLFQSYERELGLAPCSINRIMFDCHPWQRALLGEISLEKYWREIGPQLNLHTDGTISAFRQRYYADEKLNPGVGDILHRLRGRFQLAILSNHPEGLDEWLERWQLAELFDPVIVSAEVGFVKPDPQIFSILIKRLGLPAHRIVFIDDTEEHVTAARDLGITSLLFISAAQLARDLAALGCIDPATSSR